MTVPKKSYGQHFLRDESVIEKIVAAADIHPDELVVEVGPGTGALTRHIAPLAQALVLIESDRDLIESLKTHFPKARVINTDAAKVDFQTVVQVQWVFVSNLPYNAANAILMNALTTKTPPRRLVIMVQKEVGDRMLWRDPSVLSVAVSLYATVEKVCEVPPGAFVPPPKVDSVVLALTPHVFKSEEERVRIEHIIAVAKAGFGKRRKQLHNNLAEAGIGTSEVIKAKLADMGLGALIRAEELSLNDWRELAKLGSGS